MKRMAEKRHNFTDCATPVRFSNNTRATCKALSAQITHHHNHTSEREEQTAKISVLLLDLISFSLCLKHVCGAHSLTTQSSFKDPSLFVGNVLRYA